MKKMLLCLLLSIILVRTALAVNSIDLAYKRASKEAGETTTAVVESIDFSEFFQSTLAFPCHLKTKSSSGSL